MMAALVGALRRYGAEEKNDPKLKPGGDKVDFKVMMMVGLPRDLNDKDYPGSLCNNMLFTSCPLPIDQPTPETRMIGTITSMNNLKNKSYMGGVIGFTKFV